VEPGDVARWLEPVATARFREGIPSDGPLLAELAGSASARAALAGVRGRAKTGTGGLTAGS
jgi:hypothetical protein